MINIENDSHGRIYQIWKQNQANSCGVASVWMARGIARQMSFTEEEWGLAQRVYRNAVNNALAPLGVDPNGPMCLDPNAFPQDQSSMASTLANTGFFGGQLAQAISAEGLRVEHVAWTGGAHRIVANKIAYNKPAIALVAWNGGGGPFVVVGRCTNSSVSFLDPWDGHVNQEPNDGRYRARYGGRGFVGSVTYISA